MPTKQRWHLGTSHPFAPGKYSKSLSWCTSVSKNFKSLNQCASVSKYSKASSPMWQVVGPCVCMSISEKKFTSGASEAPDHQQKAYLDSAGFRPAYLDYARIIPGTSGLSGFQALCLLPLNFGPTQVLYSLRDPTPIGSSLPGQVLASFLAPTYQPPHSRPGTPAQRLRIYPQPKRLHIGWCNWMVPFRLPKTFLIFYMCGLPKKVIWSSSLVRKRNPRLTYRLGHGLQGSRTPRDCF